MGVVNNFIKIKEIFNIINKVSFTPTVIENYSEIISTGTDPEDPTYIEKYFKFNDDISKAKTVILILAYKITGTALGGSDSGEIDIFSYGTVPSYSFHHDSDDIGKVYTVAIVLQNNASITVGDTKFVSANVGKSLITYIETIKDTFTRHDVESAMMLAFKDPVYSVGSTVSYDEEHVNELYLYSDYPVDFNYLMVGLN